MIHGINDELILAARLLLATLFLIFGWRKLTDFSGTVSQMVQLGTPMPVLAAGVATFMELPVAFAVAVGAFTRPAALLMALYTLGTALIGHRYWTVKGCGLSRQHGQFLQKSQHHGRLLAVVHYRSRKIFDRCIVRHRRAITRGLLSRPNLKRRSEADGSKDDGASVDVRDNDLSPHDGRWCRNFLSRSRAEGRADDRAAARVPLFLARVRYAHPLARDTLSLIAPDFPGFGQSDAPPPSSYVYTFDNLAKTTNALLEQLKINKYTFFLHDYGGPVGFRIISAHPERLQALIIQNANVYKEGLGAKWAGIAQYWADPKAHPEVFDAFVSFAATEQRHTLGTSHPERYNPDTWTDEYAHLSRPGQREIQADLLVRLPDKRRVLSGVASVVARAQAADFGGLGAQRSLVHRSRRRRRSSAICRMPKSTCSTPAISPWTRRTTRSRVLFLRSWPNIPSDRSVDYFTHLGSFISPKSKQESSMSQVQVDKKTYQMPPKDGITVAHFLTVADVERSLRFYEKVFGGRIDSRGDNERRAGLPPDRQHVAHRQPRRRSDARQANGNAPRPPRPR